MGVSLRAWYGSSIDDFRAASREAILGTIAKNSGFDDVLTQKDAWLVQIDLLRERLRSLQGSIYFEFSIPRMGRRIDVVLLTAGIVFAIEFKVGETLYREAAVDQVWDYALDLKNFHEPSHDRTIAPILVATHAPTIGLHPIRDADGVLRPLRTSAVSFIDAISAVASQFFSTPIDAEHWLAAHTGRHQRSSKRRVRSMRSTRWRRSRGMMLARRIFASPRSTSRNSSAKRNVRAGS